MLQEAPPGESEDKDDVDAQEAEDEPGITVTGCGQSGFVSVKCQLNDYHYSGPSILQPRI